MQLENGNEEKLAPSAATSPRSRRDTDNQTVAADTLAVTSEHRGVDTESKAPTTSTETKGTYVPTLHT